MKQNIAIIGTGMAGLACATALASAHNISIFEKARGVSGRLSTRLSHYDGPQPAIAFDHGAPYFYAEDARFKDWLQPFRATGQVQAWSPYAVHIAADGAVSPYEDERELLVFSPGMNAIGKTVLGGRPNIALYVSTHIEQISGATGAWHITAGEDDFGPFDKVVLAIPSHQAVALLPPDISFAAPLAAVDMLGCHTLMLALDEAPSAAWDYARFDDEMLGFAAFNNTKPGRGAAPALVIHTRHEWSQQHIEDDVNAVAAAAKQRFSELTGLPINASAYDRIHRWRYASVAQPYNAPFALDDAQGIAAIGDWCAPQAHNSGVEAAFLSGHALAAAL